MEKLSDETNELLAKTAAIFANKMGLGIGPNFARISFFQEHTTERSPVLVGSFIMTHADAQALAELIQTSIAQATTAPQGKTVQ